MSHKDLISMHELYGFNVNEGESHRIDKNEKARRQLRVSGKLLLREGKFKR